MNNDTINLCQCGCGGTVTIYHHRPRRFISGHNMFLFKTPEEKFFERYLVSESGCWIWIAGKSSSGYGAFYFRSKTIGAHVYSYEAKHGKVPLGKVLDHFYCNNRSCVNPDHVKPVTKTENTYRTTNNPRVVAHNTQRCGNGHIWNAINTYTHPRTGWHACRICRRIKRRTLRNG